MPFYTYECEACDKEFTLSQSLTFKDEDTVCPYCNGKKTKKIKMSWFASSDQKDSGCDTGFTWGGG
ncbi:MAG TPA: zinc ribbon domain-containing protein [Nitrospirota bacterium]|nr:zinc ribbon domain-containing protein [Nitrospirota bacterium]